MASILSKIHTLRPLGHALLVAREKQLIWRQIPPKVRQCMQNHIIQRKIDDWASGETFTLA